MAGGDHMGRTDALVVRQSGHTLLELYGPEVGASTTLKSWSMAKSMLHAAVGLLGGARHGAFIGRSDLAAGRALLDLTLLLRLFGDDDAAGGGAAEAHGQGDGEELRTIDLHGSPGALEGSASTVPRSGAFPEGQTQRLASSSTGTR